MNYKLLIILSMVATFVFVYFRHDGYCFSGHRYLSNTELYAAAFTSASKSIIGTNRSSSNDFARFLNDNLDCCKVMRSKHDYMESESYRRKAMNYEGYFLPSFVGKLLATENYLVEIRYFGNQQNNRTFEASGSRVIYRIIGACGKVKLY